MRCGHSTAAHAATANGCDSQSANLESWGGGAWHIWGGACTTHPRQRLVTRQLVLCSVHAHRGASDVSAGVDGWWFSLHSPGPSLFSEMLWAHLFFSTGPAEAGLRTSLDDIHRISESTLVGPPQLPQNTHCHNSQAHPTKLTQPSSLRQTLISTLIH